MYYIKDHHKAIVPREQFNRVQKILDCRNKKVNGYDTYPLGDKLRCPYCGKPMIQRKINIYKQSRGWVCTDHNFIIQSKHVEGAIMSAFHGVDHLELARIRETGTPEEKKEAEDFLKDLQKDIHTVEFYWVDDLIDYIDLGLHKDMETRTLTVHWRCGIVTTVPTNVDPVKDDPEKLALTDKRCYENHRKWCEKQKKEQDLVEREA